MTGPHHISTDLPFRARKILYAVVSEYISTGEPVGSRRLAKHYGINLSAATIRNVLADLTEEGLLAQPHTSAGRIPTELGFRIFVDALVQIRELADADRGNVLRQMRKLKPGEEDVMREAGRFLASITGAAAVITRPKEDAEPLSQIHFMALRPGELLAVVITHQGGVQNRVIEGPNLDPQELARLHNYLDDRVTGRSLEEVRKLLAVEVEGERDQVRRLREQARTMVEATVAKSETPPEVVIEGRSVLFDRPEFSDPEKIRSYLRAFEEKGKLLELLDQTLAAGGVQVLIGSETELDDLPDVSLISADYWRGGRKAGTLGIVGPTRMDYRKLVPLVGFTAQIMGEVLDGSDPGKDAD